MATTKQLATIRRRNAVQTVQYNGKTVKVDRNMQTMLGVLRSIPGLKTAGSCGGHARRHWGECQAKIGHWFVSFRAGKRAIAKLQAFAEEAGITFEQGPRNKLAACAGKVCNGEEATWFGFWGTGDPRRVAGKLQRFLI